MWSIEATTLSVELLNIATVVEALKEHTRNRTLPQKLDHRSALSMCSCRGLPETLGRKHLQSETWVERI